MVETVRRMILPLAVSGVILTSLAHFTGIEVWGKAKDSLPAAAVVGGGAGAARGWFGRTGSGFGFGK